MDDSAEEAEDDTDITECGRRTPDVASPKLEELDNLKRGGAAKEIKS